MPPHSNNSNEPVFETEWYRAPRGRRGWSEYDVKETSLRLRDAGEVLSICAHNVTRMNGYDIDVPRLDTTSRFANAVSSSQ